MSSFFLVVFIVSTSVHLYASAKTDKLLRAKTKPFILLALTGFYFFSASDPKTVIILALLFSWLGDLFLIPHGVKWFTCGGISFMLSHALFITSYAPDVCFENINVVIVIILALVYTTAVLILFSKLKAFLPTVLFYPMFLYLLLNGTMNCFAVFRMLSNPTINTITTCIGAVLFFISDSSLFFVRFNKNGRLKTHFLVMLTYTLGEFLIVLGLI